jgi:glyoxylase I family protein
MSISGFRHIGLTVTDLDRSVAWYREVLDFQELFSETSSERSAAILRVPDTPAIVGLVQFSRGGGQPFAAQQTGLDHLCFSVADRSDLLGWAERLDQHGVAPSGVLEMATGPIINFKDPDGIALAIAPPPRAPQSHP